MLLFVLLSNLWASRLIHGIPLLPFNRRGLLNKLFAWKLGHSIVLQWDSISKRAEHVRFFFRGSPQTGLSTVYSFGPCTFSSSLPLPAFFFTFTWPFVPPCNFTLMNVQLTWNLYPRLLRPLSIKILELSQISHESNTTAKARARPWAYFREEEVKRHWPLLYE